MVKSGFQVHRRHRLPVAKVLGAFCETRIPESLAPWRDPGTSSVSLPRKVPRNAQAQAHPRPTESAFSHHAQLIHVQV